MSCQICWRCYNCARLPGNMSEALWGRTVCWLGNLPFVASVDQLILFGGIDFEVIVAFIWLWPILHGRFTAVSLRTLDWD